MDPTPGLGRRLESRPAMNTLITSLGLTLACAGSLVAQEFDQAELEARFVEQMSGCRMIGSFTMFGQDRPPAEESYTITKVEKVRDEKWRFDAKIEYGGRSSTLPVVAEVRWAGDTPMIQVTDMGFPGMGTYTARVLIYDGYYAGYWAGVGYGGHMFGRIEKLGAEGEQEQGKDKDKEKNKGKDKQDGGDTPESGTETVAVLSARLEEANWPNWRGPNNDGLSASQNPPTEWAEDRNIRWKVELPGLGSSTPIVWGDRLYLTTAIETEVEGEMPAYERPGRGGNRGNRGGRGGRGGRRGGGGGGGEAEAKNKVYDFAVLAVDRADGSVVWQKTINEVVPHERGHATATQASNSPLTDGEHLYAFFGSRGLHCLDMDGEVVWSKEFGPMFTRNQFGEGASPALYGDTLVVNWDHEGDSFILALNKSTGEELWRKERDEPTSWSTPLVVEVDGKPQVVVSATNASRGYDLASGDVVWSCTGMTTNAIPTPLHRDGVAYLMSGFRGNMLQAIELAGARGDLSDGDKILWSHAQGTSYVPSALLYQDYIYFLRVNTGVLSCLDANTGQVQFEGQRMSGVRTVYASPVGAADKVYIASREGVTKVLELGPEYVELASNALEDTFDASPVIVDDEIYLRGWQSLYCISEQ